MRAITIGVQAPSREKLGTRFYCSSELVETMGAVSISSFVLPGGPQSLLMCQLTCSCNLRKQLGKPAFKCTPGKNGERAFLPVALCPEWRRVAAGVLMCLFENRFSPLFNMVLWDS